MAEADSVASATGGVSVPWIELRLRALQGSEAEAAAAISRAIEQSAAGEHGLAIWAHWAAAVLYNGLSQYEQAVVSARLAALTPFDYFVSAWVLPELVEAAARLDDMAGAQEALAQLAETTEPAANDFALGIEARCRALVSNGADADDAYREAIGRLGRTQLRPELGRAHLLFGEWLRREGRRVDAREELRAAHNIFTAIGMEAFANRTRQELLATGETVRKRSPDTREGLTPQEEQIARLARDHHSNADIARQLFLSTRTVEWHLRKVYTKLGITSRQELARSLTDS
jgi:DNA-binding CsgD family transcriptional regulator